MSEQCPNCGEMVEVEELIQFDDVQVCIHCKEEYAQRLKEGLDPSTMAGEAFEGRIIRCLHYGNTWKLFGLGLITLGIYFGHYMVKKNRELNGFLSEHDRISPGLAMTILVMSYASIIMYIPSMIFMDLYDPMGISSEWFIVTLSAPDLLDSVIAILMLVWGFKARHRMNVLLHARPKSVKWFHGGGTFFFTPMYFNWKINTLSEKVRRVERAQA